MKDERSGIRYLFEPRTVAVVGASSNPGKIGFKIVQNIVTDGYKGKLYPVNPRGGEVLGMPIRRGLDEIDGEIDLAVVTIPAEYAYEAVVQAADLGVRYAAVITSGFSEIGNTDEERKMVAYARERGMGILGPNIFGVFSAKPSLNATFGPANIMHGNVAIVTQSGALGIAMIGRTSVENVGLSAIVSVGNKADVDEADLLRYLVEDDQTKVIMLYVEGVRDGERFVEVLRQVTKQKPVVVIKSGRSKRGAIAAASHTGSLAGADDIFDAIMRQCGVLRAESLQEAFNWCKFLADSPEPDGENVVIVTNGGGVGVMATDACEKHSVNLYDDTKTLKEVFSPVTPSFGSTKNPIDLTGQAGAEHYRRAIGAGLTDDKIHTVLGLYCETALFDVDSLTGMIRKSVEDYREKGKPIMFSIIGGETTEAAINSLRKERIPLFPDVYEAVSCLGALYRHHRHVNQPAEGFAESELDVGKVNRVVEKARADNRTFLLPTESREVMDATGITLPKSYVVRSLAEAVEKAEGIGYPVVMKIVSKDIIHKSDAGGVALDLENKDEVIDAYQAIMHNARKYDPKAVIEGVEVNEMIKVKTETIVGARRDRAFGPIVMFGLGGIYVEVMKDVVFRSAPLTRSESLNMVQSIRSYPLLLGVRGEKRKDIEAVVEAIIKLGTLIRKCPGISDIELNPLVVYDHGSGVKALDVRILLSSNQ